MRRRRITLQRDPNRNVRNSRAPTDGLDGLASCLADATQRKSLVPVPAPTATKGAPLV
jgi:hypothetical protein